MSAKQNQGSWSWLNYRIRRWFSTSSCSWLEPLALITRNTSITQVHLHLRVQILHLSGHVLDFGVQHACINAITAKYGASCIFSNHFSEWSEIRINTNQQRGGTLKRHQTIQDARREHLWFGYDAYIPIDKTSGSSNSGHIMIMELARSWKGLILAGSSFGVATTLSSVYIFCPWNLCVSHSYCA